MSDLENVIIVGSGPAGYTAALYTARANLKPLVFEGFAWGGLLQQTTDVENYPGFPEGIMGPEMMQKFRDQAERFGARLETEEAERVELSEGARRPSPGVGRRPGVRARTIVLAMGAEHKKLDVAGEDELSGRGVSYCATCDAAFFRQGAPTIIVGGGDSAMEEAMFLSKFASKVTIVNRRDEFRASQIMLERARAQPNIEFLIPYTVERVPARRERRPRPRDPGQHGDRRGADLIGVGELSSRSATSPSPTWSAGSVDSTQAATSSPRAARRGPTCRACSPPATSSITPTARRSRPPDRAARRRSTPSGTCATRRACRARRGCRSATPQRRRGRRRPKATETPRATASRRRNRRRHAHPTGRARLAPGAAVEGSLELEQEPLAVESRRRSRRSRPRRRGVPGGRGRPTGTGWRRARCRRARAARAARFRSDLAVAESSRRGSRRSGQGPWRERADQRPVELERERAPLPGEVLVELTLQLVQRAGAANDAPGDAPRELFDHRRLVLLGERQTHESAPGEGRVEGSEGRVDGAVGDSASSCSAILPSSRSAAAAAAAASARRGRTGAQRPADRVLGAGRHAATCALSFSRPSCRERRAASSEQPIVAAISRWARSARKRKTTAERCLGAARGRRPTARRRQAGPRLRRGCREPRPRPRGTPCGHVRGGSPRPCGGRS